MHSLIRSLSIALLFSACMPGEEPVEPYPRGDRKEVFLSTGENKNQVHFYDLEAGAVLATADPMDWDVVFDGNAKINYHRFLRAAESDIRVEDVQDTTGLSFSSLQQDSAQWQLQADRDYVIDMGVNSSVQTLGFMRFRFTVEGDSMRCHYGPLGAPLAERSFAGGSYVQLRDGNTVDLPLAFDLSFGKYVHYFVDEEVEYEVYGALGQKLQIAVTAVDFDAIDATVADTLSWSNRADAIGYDWKYYNLDKGAYEIDMGRNYVIRTAKGFLYKFRFTNFYDPEGKSGHPTFEFQLI